MYPEGLVLAHWLAVLDKTLLSVRDEGYRFRVRRELAQTLNESALLVLDIINLSSARERETDRQQFYAEAFRFIEGRDSQLRKETGSECKGNRLP